MVLINAKTGKKPGYISMELHTAASSKILYISAKDESRKIGKSIIPIPDSYLLLPMNAKYYILPDVGFLTTDPSKAEDYINNRGADSYASKHLLSLV